MTMTKEIEWPELHWVQWKGLSARVLDEVVRADERRWVEIRTSHDMKRRWVPKDETVPDP
jgi:hypothetical protein